MHRSRLLGAAALGTALAAAALLAPAAPASVRDGREVLVRFKPGVTPAQRAAVARATGTAVAAGAGARRRALAIRDGGSVAATVTELRARPEVAAAAANHVARIAAGEPIVPNDAGRANQPGGWQALQWNFLAATGVNAPQAWGNLVAAGAPGGRGTVVAVLDTGVAYGRRGRYVRSPDFSAWSFVAGYDFVDRDRYPHDENGHGTHVASTIVEATGNGVGLTGLAYGARVMPIRVLDRVGEGDVAAIAEGIRFAARRGAHVINLSFEFSSDVDDYRQIPEIISAMKFARRRGALVIGAAGNAARDRIAYPARSSAVMSVGATTEHGCLADYSNVGRGLDIVAPGGGPDATLPGEEDRCRPLEPPGRDIFQMTFSGRSFSRFGYPSGYQGTSMATPHVAATAALVIASGVLGDEPTPTEVEKHLERTARDLGAPGPDLRYGAGLLDAAAATNPLAPAA